MVRLLQVPFGDGVAFNVRNDEDKAALLRRLSAVLGGGIQTRPPHRERYTFAKHAAALRQGQFLACASGGGTPLYLWLTRLPQTVSSVCILVGKCVSPGFFYPRMSLVRLAFKDELFEDTVFDCELVRYSSQKHRLFINDLLTSISPKQQKTTLLDRLSAASKMLSTAFFPDRNLDPFALSIKPWMPLRDLRNFDLESLGYPCNCILFRRVLSDPRMDRRFNSTDVVFTFYHGGGGGKNSAAAADGPGRPQEQEQEQDEEEDEKAPTEKKPEEQQQEQEELAYAQFYVRKTNMPDVFELFPTLEEMRAAPLAAPGNIVAGVPSLQASRYLLESLSSPCCPAPQLTFVYSKQFMRWVPALES